MWTAVFGLIAHFTVRMSSTGLCNKCRQSPSIGEDTWCMGCAALENLQADLKGRWVSRDLRRAANDLLWTARQVKQLKSLSVRLEPVTACPSPGGTGKSSAAAERGACEELASTSKKHPPPKAPPVPPPREEEKEVRKQKHRRDRQEKESKSRSAKDKKHSKEGRGKERKRRRKEASTSSSTCKGSQHQTSPKEGSRGIARHEREVT